MFTTRFIAIVFCVFTGCGSKPVAQSQKFEQIKKPLATLDGFVALDFSPDKKWLAIGAELIETDNWKVAGMLEKRISEDNPKSRNHWGYVTVGFSPDSKTLVLGDEDGTLRILEVPSMKMSKEYIAHGARVTGIGFANDNETFVTTSRDESIRMWNARTGKELFRDGDKASKEKSIAGYVGTIDVFALSPNRELFAAIDLENWVVIGSMRDGSILHRFKGPGGDAIQIDSAAFTSDSKQLLIVAVPKVYVLNVDDQATVATIETKANSPMFVKTINESGLIAMQYGAPGSTMEVVEFYDLAQAKSLGTFVPHQHRAYFWGVSPNGEYLATTGKGGPVRVWKMAEIMQDLFQGLPPNHKD